MEKNMNVYKYLKELFIPEIDNKNHQKILREKLSTKINKIKTKESLFKKPVLKYAFSFALIFIILFAGFFFLSKVFYSSNIKGSLMSLKGNVHRVKQGREKYITSFKDKILIRGDIIKTDADSEITIKLGKKSIVKMDELTEIKFLGLKKKKENEHSRIFMNKGRIQCSVNLPTKDSIFEILTDISTFTVKGTKFSIKINENQDIKLEVSEGMVEVSNYIRPSRLLKKIKRKNKNFYQLIYDISNKKVLVNQNNSIIICKTAVHRTNQDLNLFIKKAYSKINKQKSLNKAEKNNLTKLEIESKKIIKKVKFDKSQLIKEIENIQDEECINEEKIKTNPQFKNFVFIYKWADNRLLDEKVEKLKQNITTSIKKSQICSISEDNLEIYYREADILLFFIKYQDIISTYEKKKHLEKYFPVTYKELKRLLLNERIVFISKTINKKNVILFGGKTESDLVEVIERDKEGIF